MTGFIIKKHGIPVRNDYTEMVKVFPSLESAQIYAKLSFGPFVFTDAKLSPGMTKYTIDTIDSDDKVASSKR